MADNTNEILQSADIMSELEKNSPDVVLPTGYVFQRSTAAIVQSKDSAAMSATFAIVTRTQQPNRYGNQLQMLPNANGNGPQTQYYAANPVVLYDHGMSGLTLPVGLSSKGGQLQLAWDQLKGIATCYFADQPWAEPIFAAVDDGLLKMASIGFDPILAMRLKPAGPQQAAAPDGIMDMTWLGMDFTEWELLEWSIVPIGADRGALRQCLDRGNIHGVKLPRFLKQSFLQHAAEVTKPGIGFDLKKIQSGSLTIEGPADQVDSAVEKLQAKSTPPTCATCGDSKKMRCPACASAGCDQCMMSGMMPCSKCVKQSDSEPDPDIAPDMSMSYPSPDELAQACSANIIQSQIQAVETSVMQGVSKAVQVAVTPVAKSIQSSEKELRRMTGKIDG